MSHCNIRKNPHAHKNKIGTSTPPSKKAQNPPPKGGILWAWGFPPAERTQKCQVPINRRSHFRPRIAGRNFMDITLFLQYTPFFEMIQKYASDPHPPHTRQKYEQTSGQNLTPNASKQGKFSSLGAIFLFIFLPCMWGLGLQKESPMMFLLGISHVCFVSNGTLAHTSAHLHRNSQDAQPPLTPRQALDYRGRVPDASP